MSKPVLDNKASSSKSSNGNPPELRIDCLSMRDVKAKTKDPKDANVPVDVLLLTVKNCEFLACYNELQDPYKCWFDGLGYIYFSHVDQSQEEKVKVALLRCCKNGIGPGGSLISVKNAASKLRPKAVISVGACTGLNPNKTKLGDVIVSAKLTTYQGRSTSLRSCVSRRFLDVIKYSSCGWEAPLKDPAAQEILVHCDGEFLSGREEVSAEWRCQQLAELHPDAVAVETEGEGIFTAAFDTQIEWLIVKGIADYADCDQLTSDGWVSCASVMAASLVTHILSDPVVFRSWPHYQDLSELDSASNSKKPRLSSEDSADAFLKWSQNQLCSLYNGTLGQVMITPWNPDDTMDMDEVYVQLTLLRDERKLDGTTKTKFEDYSEIFSSHGRHLLPKRILVYGHPGVGKSTFSKKLAVDWTRGEKEIFKQFTVLLLIKLRDVCNTPSVCAMLEQAELLSAENPLVFKQLYDYILQNQEKVLLVLDGFDEYSAGKSSPIHHIWRGSLLRDCMTIVTTRPSKEDELRKSSHVQFEINGFTNDQIVRFAEKFFSHRKDITAEFTKFLSERKLWGMAKIPLLLLMLCLTWKKRDHGDQEQSHTRADLYERFFQTLLDHVAAKTSCHTFTSLDEYKDDLTKLGKVAFDALLTDCLYFELSKVPADIRFLVKKFLSVGFFQVSKLSSSSRPGEIVHFLHKSVQEFLSAWFIVKEVTKTKTASLTCLSNVDSFEKVKKMYEVLKFVCEISSEAAVAVFRHLQMIGKKEGLTEYCFSFSPSTKDLSADQIELNQISLDCFLSCPAPERQITYPSFLHCVNGVLVISRSDQLSIVAREHVLKLFTTPKPDYVFFPQRPGMVKDTFPVMCDLQAVVVPLFGDHDSKLVNTYEHLDLFYPFVEKEEQQMVLYITCLQRLFDSQLYLDLLNDISEPQSPTPQTVDEVPQDETNNSSRLTKEKCGQTKKHSLSYLREVLVDYPSPEKLLVVGKLLKFVNRLETLRIKLDRKYWQEGLYDVQVVESLVSHIYLTYFTDSLRSLELTFFHMTQILTARIVRLLFQAPNLRSLNLSWNCLSYSGIKNLTENLRHLKHLSHLELRGVGIGHLACQLLSTSLKYVSNLQVLDLSQNPLAHGILELSKNLNCIPRLNKLVLYHTDMGEREVTAVARVLKDTPELRELDLSHNPLGRGVGELIKHLKSVPGVRFLELSSVPMTRKEVSDLYTAVNPLTGGIVLNTDYHYHLDQVVLWPEDVLKQRGVSYDDDE